jgi:hypothetical protein
MKYVLDSSAALPRVLPEKDSAKAIRLRDEARNGLHELLAPDIFPAEVFNALLKAERTQRINVGEAKTLYASIGADIPVLHPYLPLMPRAAKSPPATALPCTTACTLLLLNENRARSSRQTRESFAFNHTFHSSCLSRLSDSMPLHQEGVRFRGGIIWPGVKMVIDKVVNGRRSAASFTIHHEFRISRE